MEIKQAYRRKDGTYVVDGYHVCPKSLDPYGAYDIIEVEAYLAEHEDALVDEPKLPEPTKEELIARRKAEIRSALDALDRKSIRPIRSLWADINVVEEQKVLDGYEAQAMKLREELKALG